MSSVNIATQSWNTNYTSGMSISITSSKVTWGISSSEVVAYGKTYVTIDASKYKSITLNWGSGTHTDNTTMLFGVFDNTTASDTTGSTYELPRNSSGSTTLSLDGVTGTKYVGFQFWGNTWMENGWGYYAVEGDKVITSIMAELAGYTLTYDANGGSGAPSAVSDATSTTISSTVPTRTGYNFLGWSTSSSATSASYVAGDTISLSANTTLYAVWEIITYTITYNANGHGTAPSSQTKTYGVALTLQSFIANQTGTGYTVSFNANGGASTPSSLTSTLTYAQTYWNTNSSGTGTNYSSGGSYTTNAVATLYAIWSTTNGSITLPSAITHNGTSATYTISYSANGGSSTPASQTLTRKTAKTFNKWNTASDGSGTAYSAGGSFTPSSATTLYATFTSGSTTGSITLASAISRSSSTATGYKVTFDANGGTCSTSSLTSTKTIKYSFSSWKGSNGSTYAAGATYSTSANLTLTAVWSSSTTNGKITLPTPTRDGYTFCGWATSASADTGVTGTYTPTSNQTLYAVWASSGLVYIDTGSAYEQYQIYIDNGTSWDLYIPYIDNGTSWDLCT